LSGRLAEAAEVLVPRLEPGVAPTLTEGELAYARTKLGFLLLSQGRAHSARQQLGAAAAALADADPNGCRVWCLSLAAQAAALSGHGDEAARLVNQAMALRRSGFALWDGDAARARAWVAAAAGERSRAITELLDAASAQQQRGQPGLAIFACHDAVRLGARQAAGHLEALAGGLDGPYAAAAALHAAAVRTDDPARLEAAAKAFTRLGFWLVAAEIAAQASAAWSARGLMARAAGAAEAMDLHLSQCEVALAPSLPGPAPVSVLTPREREIAVLAGQGLSNSEIAQRLVVSVRTVESHLYAAYGKLGISDRAELRVLLRSASTT
jgi:DNA-binding CsgD family transcriptional regulator